MSEETEDNGNPGGGFLARKHNQLRFTELGETFFGRLVLAKCPDPNVTRAVTVQLSLSDLFRRFAPDELVALLANETVSEAPKILEIVGDVVSALLGGNLKAGTTTEHLLDYYQNHIETRLRWLKSGGPERPTSSLY